MILPLIAIMLMMNFNLPDDSKTTLFMSLSMYRDPQAFVHARNKIFAEKYAIATASQGGVAKDVSNEANLNEGKFKDALRNESSNKLYLLRK